MEMLPREPEAPDPLQNDVLSRAAFAPADPPDRVIAGRRAAASDPAYVEWDRSEWVGEGQEPPGAPASPRSLEPEVRWTKWEWIGEGQGAAGPNRGAPAAAMPDGENAFSGGRRNPGMAHWGGRRPYIRRDDSRGRRGETRDRVARTGIDRDR